MKKWIFIVRLALLSVAALLSAVVVSSCKKEPRQAENELLNENCAIVNGTKMTHITLLEDFHYKGSKQRRLRFNLNEEQTDVLLVYVGGEHVSGRKMDLTVADFNKEGWWSVIYLHNGVSVAETHSYTGGNIACLGGTLMVRLNDNNRDVEVELKNAEIPATQSEEAYNISLYYKSSLATPKESRVAAPKDNALQYGSNKYDFLMGMRYELAGMDGFNLVLSPDNASVPEYIWIGFPLGIPREADIDLSEYHKNSESWKIAFGYADDSIICSDNLNDNDADPILGTLHIRFTNDNDFEITLENGRFVSSPGGIYNPGKANEVPLSFHFKKKK